MPSRAWRVSRHPLIKCIGKTWQDLGGCIESQWGPHMGNGAGHWVRIRAMGHRTAGESAPRAGRGGQTSSCGQGGDVETV